MAWQSPTINPVSTSPATDISKITNDLGVLKGVIGGTADAAVPSVWTTPGNVLAQSANSGTTGGTSTAYTLTPSSAIAAYTAGQTFWVTFHAASGATPTLAVSGLASPPNLVRQLTDGTYANIASGDIPINHRSRVTLLSATQALVEDMPPPAATQNTPPVRQTMLSGPVDSNGLPSFGGSTGSTTVTASGTLVAAAANGFGASGSVDRIGSITNPSWTGLSTNGTMYLYLDIASNGVCTTGSTTLAPTYRWGGADVVTNNQFTFNIQEMVGKVGNGSTAAQTYRVFVGEVTVAGGVVTAITWYALMGRYQIPLTAMTAANTAVSWSHNLGVMPREFQVRARCVVAANNNAVGDEITVPLTTDPANGNLQPGLTITQKVVRFFFTTLYVADGSTGSTVSLVSNTNYNWTGYVMRGW